MLTRALEVHVDADTAAATATLISPAEDLLADARVDLDLVESPGDQLGPNPEQFLAETAASTLPDAVAELVELFGPDREKWSWGRLHVARPRHPLAALLTRVPEDQLVAGSAPHGGSGDTVGDTAYGANFVQSAGATVRVVVDVGGWDTSLAMNAPGQSGRLGDPHTTDLFEQWSRGGAFPLLYSRGRVEQAAEQLIDLYPSC